ncbi:branched-chain amino acid ABC transporter substrate-binding protein [Actinocorallia longicatena]|uniref:Branched-chain amino acid ABC transporter substrate-binding protein n=1 Tax=Actinocorallia longicatena TaxID=111803 RepID=A0ABP6Q959_9ACTN
MKRVPPVMRLLAVAGAASLVLTACGGSDDKDGGSPSGGELKLAFIGAQTGPNAQLGINISNGVELAIAQYNATNPAKKVTLAKYDTKGDPAAAPAQADTLIEAEPIGIIGPAFSGESKAVVPKFEEAKIPSISPSATSTKLAANGWKYWHRVITNDDSQGAEDAKAILTQLKAKSVFLVDDNEEYSIGLAGKFVEAIKAGGVTPGTDKIDPNANDYSSTINKIKAAKPDVVFFAGYYAAGGKLLKQMRDGGVTAKFFSDDGALDQGLIDAAGAKQAEGAIISCACQSVNPTADNPAVGKFITDYKAKFNADQGTYSAEGFDVANIYLEGIKAGNDTPEKLNEYLKTVNVKGISKPIKFTETGEIEDKSIFYFLVKSGKLEFVGAADKIAS